MSAYNNMDMKIEYKCMYMYYCVYTSGGRRV